MKNAKLSAAPLILFGAGATQRILLDVHRHGVVASSNCRSYVVFRTGLLHEYQEPGFAKARRTFDVRHPAYAEIRAALRQISGEEGREPRAPAPSAEPIVNPESPLGHHHGSMAFRLIHRVRPPADPSHWNACAPRCATRGRPSFYTTSPS